MRAAPALRQAARTATRTTPRRLGPLSSSSLCSSFSRLTPHSPAILGATRLFSSSPSRASITSYTIGELSDREYQDAAEATMDHLTEYLEEKLEELDIEGSDVEYSTSTCGKSGVLTVKLGEKGTYVINKQPPNKQIWLSSPISGPKRYDYDTKHRVWFYHRDGGVMHDLLTRELRELLGEEDILIEPVWVQ
ncbi:hypothetical protein JCM8547_006216 [Rhodosporidiobolus lusitaniae]